MQLVEVFEQLRPPVGVTSLIAAPESVADRPSEIPTLETAQARLAELTEAQLKCGSGAAWWGYEGQLAYWRSFVNLLHAAAITGPDDLPDVPLPGQGGVVMDNMATMERFGNEVLKRAKAQS